MLNKITFRTPATNKYYLGQPHGEIYGLDHSYERFQPELLAKLRPDTDIAGLYLSGQDIFMAGFMGKASGQLSSHLIALCSGMVDLNTASQESILDEVESNLMFDKTCCVFKVGCSNSNSQ